MCVDHIFGVTDVLRIRFSFVFAASGFCSWGMERHDATLPILVISSSVELAWMWNYRRGAGVSRNSWYQLLLLNIRHQKNLTTFFSPCPTKEVDCTKEHSSKKKREMFLIYNDDTKVDGYIWPTCPDDGECHVLAVETRKFQCTDSPYFSPDPRSARHLAVDRTTTY